MPRPLSITDLSQELITNILCSLDDIYSLPPALLSCRRFYDSLTNVLPAQILQRQIPASLFPYAAAVHSLPQTRLVTKPDVDTVLRWLRYDPRSCSPRITSIDLSSALKIGRMHGIVQRLADEVAKDSLTKLYEGGLPASKLELSAREHHRICRALYRLELCYKLFRLQLDGGFILSIEEGETLFVRCYLPWVNEQLVCIHKFLEKKLCDSVSAEVSAPELRYGEVRISIPSNARGGGWKEYLMSQGLDFLCRLADAPSYWAKADLLFAAMDARRAFLTPVPDEANHKEPEMESSDHEKKDLPVLRASPMRDFTDLDPGPFESWTQGNKDECTTSSASLRERGYVMWDPARIVEDCLIAALSAIE